MSELDNVKNQVQLAAKSIDEAAQATQTAYSNADDKKERLNAMGVHASSQGLEQACEKLQNALVALATAHGEATKATTELQNVETTMPIPEALPKLTSAASELDTAATNLTAAAELATNAKTDAQQVGVEGIVAVCQGALDMIDAAKASIGTATNATNGYHKRLEQEATELAGLSTGASTPTGTESDSTPTAQPRLQPEPAGKWVPTPGGQRHFGNDFNRRYEEWIRTSTGGPSEGSEYLVERNGKKVHFDATVVEDRDGKPTEILIDAKGQYAQFVNKKTGEFHSFFRNQPGKGVLKAIDDAGRQADAAGGRPVEWWCAEQDAADAFEDVFEDNAKTQGRVHAVYKPMPEQ